MRSPSKPFAHQGGVVLLAHRGFSSRYPENTMLAFEKAAELPIDGLEMDIHATRDDVLVVIHDESVDRTTNGTGPVQSFSLAELQALDAGYRFTPDGGQTYPFRGMGVTIPTLESVLARFPGRWINVDIKQEEAHVVSLFRDLIKRMDVAEQLCVGSFSTETLEQFRAACPTVVTVASVAETFRLYYLHKFFLDFLFRGGGHPLQIPLQFQRFGLTLNLFTPRFLKAAHRHNMAVHLWTINEADAMRRFIEMGVDGIITDYPDRAVQICNR
jgi:glycerophosphoryl diester phosphodiesterase